MGSIMQHVERELQYICSSSSGSVMGSNIGSSSLVDVWQQAKNQHRGLMQRINVMLL